MTEFGYSTGTIAVAANGKTCTLTGGGSALLSLKVGDLIILEGDAQSNIIVSIASTLVFEIAITSSLADTAGIAYQTVRSGPDWAGNVAIHESTTALISSLRTLDAYGRGLFYVLSDDTGDSDPGNGYIRFNDADPTSATEAYIDNVDRKAQTNTGLIDLWGDGTIITTRSVASNAFVAHRLSESPLDGTGYRRMLSLTLVASAGILIVGEDVTIEFNRDGAGLAIDATGTFAGRDANDGAAAKFIYLSTDGDGDAITKGVIFIKNSASNADWSDAVEFQGPRGYAGWSPLYSISNDGARRVYKLEGYAGGAGTEPTDYVGEYVGPSGYVADIANGVDVRGPAGATGAAGGGLKGLQVRLVLDAVNLANELEAGDMHQSVTLDENDIVLAAAQTAGEDSGIYVVPASGAAVRHDDFDEYDKISGGLFTVAEGDYGPQDDVAGKVWQCTSGPGGTIDTDVLEFMVTGGGNSTTTIAFTADFSVILDHAGAVLLVNAAAGAVDATLLSAETAGDGFRVSLKKTGTTLNLVTIDDGDGFTHTLRLPGQSVELASDGDDWYIIAEAGLTEVGSNGNGNYERNANGTLLCWSVTLSVANVTTAQGALFGSGGSAVNWTFPFVFASKPSVHPSIDNPGLFGGGGGTAGSTTAAVFNVYYTSAVAGPFTCHCMAIGRWY